MIPGRLTIVSLVSIMAVTGCHRSLNHAARDAAAGDLELPAGGNDGGAGQGAGGGGAAGGAGGTSGGVGGGAAGGATGAGGAVGGVGGSGTGGAGGPPDGGSPGDAGRSDGDSGNGVTYTACGFVGNLDHLTVTKRDPGRNLCVVLSLFSPVFQNPNTLGILLPPRWAVQQAAVMPMSAGVCGMTIPISASSGSGAVGINGTLFGTPAATVDIAVTLMFPPSAGNPTPPESLNALGLQVGYGC